jgi:hypothetical protein
MRLAKGGVAATVLAGLLVGCAESKRPAASVRPAQPVVATIVLKVPGMT